MVTPTPNCSNFIGQMSSGRRQKRKMSKRWPMVKGGNCLLKAMETDAATKRRSAVAGACGKVGPIESVRLCAGSRCLLDGVSAAI